MFDLHTHTIFSDGINTLDEMIESAIKVGMSTIGIADHYTPNADGTRTKIAIGEAELDNYFNAIREAKEKYKDKINVLASVEMDYYDESFHACYEQLMKHNPDYVLCSIHNTTRELSPWNINDYPEHKADFPKNFIQKAINAVNTGCLDIIGHFNCYLVAGDIDESPYYPMFDELAEACLKHNTVLELDTAMLDNLVLDPYIYRKCTELGVPVIVDSDAHERGNLLYKFGGAFEFLKKENIKLVPMKDFCKNKKLWDL